MTTEVAVDGPVFVTVIVYVSVLAGGDGRRGDRLGHREVGVAGHVRRRPGRVVVRVGVGGALVTRAMSVSAAAVEPGGTVVRTVIVTTAPAAIVPTEQESTLTLAMHGPCVDDAVTETPGGSSSVTVTPVAGLGPPLRTVIVDVTTLPATTGSGVLTFVTTRSADGTTAIAAAPVENVRSCSSATVAPS